VETALDPSWPAHVALRLTDNGPGIPREHLAKLFEPFFSTKPAGNGLGLAIVSRLLHAGGGHITAASAPESGGATFTIFLPRFQGNGR
jgi:signal transduction histidine kinase